MAGLRFTDLQSRPLEFLDFTSLTLNEFQQLVPPFETAFHARMAAWRMDGKPRTARRFTVDKNCPLPTPEDRLLFILVYLKTLCTPGGARALMRHGPGQSQSVDPRPAAGVARGAARPWCCPRPLPLGPGPAPRCLRGRRRYRGHPARGGVRTRRRRTHRRTGGPPFAHDGTERRIVRPQDPPAQTAC
jgi:hypothetical protein